MQLTILFVDVDFHSSVWRMDKGPVGAPELEKQQEHFGKQAREKHDGFQQLPVIEPPGNGKHHCQDI
jgi:hypothetical protein